MTLGQNGAIHAPPFHPKLEDKTLSDPYGKVIFEISITLRPENSCTYKSDGLIIGSERQVPYGSYKILVTPPYRLA